MLSRPEIGTREHIQLWLTGKPAGEPYEWLSGDCPAGQYMQEFGDEHTGLKLDWINRLAMKTPHTWGALAERMRNS